jgi:hypothetical protein
VVRLLLKESI